MENDMSYATEHDLKNRLGSAFAEIYPDPTVSIEDLQDAQAEIDGTLMMYYQVPVTAEQALPLLKGWTLTLAEERAYARTAGSRFSDKIRKRVDQVRARLSEIRKEQFILPGAEKCLNSQVSFLEMDMPVFTRKNLKDF
jgi:phage gp36-like protein